MQSRTPPNHRMSDVEPRPFKISEILEFYGSQFQEEELLEEMKNEQE